VARTSHLSNDIVVAAASRLNGNPGENYWDGNIELRDALTLNYLGAESTDFDHWFTGTLAINQDAGFPNARVIDVHGRGGETTFAGNIVDGPGAGARFPLTIGSRESSPGVRAGEIYIEGLNNTYAAGTVVAYWPTRGNDSGGVTVRSGSRLGRGPVTVQGTHTPATTGARLTLRGRDAIANTAHLTLIGGGTVVLPNGGQVETVGRLVIDGQDPGQGLFGSADYPDNIEGLGKIRVRYPGLLLHVR
jgi:hypothetical protein